MLAPDIGRWWPAPLHQPVQRVEDAPGQFPLRLACQTHHVLAPSRR